MCGAAYPKLSPFVSAFFQPVSGVEHKEVVEGMSPFMDFDRRFANLAQLTHHSVVVGNGFNHDHIVQTNKNDRLQQDAVDTLVRASNWLHRQGLPFLHSQLGGRLRVSPAYYRHTLGLGNYLDLSHEEREALDQTKVAASVRTAIKRLVYSAGLTEVEYSQFEVVVACEPRMARLFGDTDFQGVRVKFFHSLNLQLRNRFFISLRYTGEPVAGYPQTMGAYLSLPDEPMEEVMMGQPVTHYHCQTRPMPLVPVLADIRLMYDVLDNSAE